MKLITFNVRYSTSADGRHAWDRRKHRVVEELARLAPDLLALQEVLPEQRAFLDSALGARYQGVGQGRDADRGGEQCPIFFRHDRFLLRDWTTVWLSDTPTVPGSRSWASLTPYLPRIATCLRLTSKGDRAPWTIFNTHWDHQWPQARSLSAALLLERVQQAMAVGEMVAVLGDLNATEDEEGIVALSSRLTNAYRRCRPQGLAPCTYHGYGGPAAADGCHIDYIFLDPRLSVESCDVLLDSGPAFLSDHFPVQAEIA